ncbi:MAG: hypothetical protein ACLQM6_09885 [Acidobacteriaceae bacterium]
MKHQSHRCGERRAEFAEVVVAAGKLLRYEAIASTGRRVERERVGMRRDIL